MPQLERVTLSTADVGAASPKRIILEWPVRAIGRDGVQCGPSACRQFELEENIGDVPLDGVVAQIEPVGDGGIT